MDKSELLTLKQNGLGTSQAGYVDGSYGPFLCRNCDYFDSGKSACNHPRVGQDTQITSRLPDGRPRVEAEGCCNFYWEKHLDPAKYAKEQGKDTKSPHGFPGGIMTAVGVKLKGK